MRGYVGWIGIGCFGNQCHTNVRIDNVHHLENYYGSGCMTMYDTLHDLFEYRDENLYWKERPSNRVDISKPAGNINAITGYRQIRIKGKNYRAHRLIYQMFNEQWDITDTSQDNSVDHADRDKLNNNIDNLRVATQSQQQHNTGNMKNNTSGTTGVCWHKASGKWQVQVAVNKKQQHGGLFVNKEDAIAKATEMRDELHGEFANHD